MATVGIIANPAAGKDIRRLVASASPSSDVSKIGMIRRAVIGAVEGGARRILLSGDRQELARRALDGLESLGAELEIFDDGLTGDARDTTDAAQRMAKEDTGAVVVLGGDGTHRDVARGWLEAPLVAVSIGTNNVFPSAVEATIAGHAAARVATGAVALDHVSATAKVIHAAFGGAEPEDLALVEVALIDGSFVGSRAVWDATALRVVVAAIAEPTTVGLSAVAAMAHAVARDEPGGVRVDIGAPGTSVRAPIAPGLYAEVDVERVTRFGEGDEATLMGPGVCTFDGERDRVLAADDEVRLVIRRDGPRVIDIERAMRAIAPKGD